MEEPIPPVRRVTQLTRIEERGAKVVYKKPQWKEEDRLPKQTYSFKFPAERRPGVGAGRIRARRVRLFRQVGYALP